MQLGVRHATASGCRRMCWELRRNADLWKGTLGEDTAGDLDVSIEVAVLRAAGSERKSDGYLHQQTSFPAGTIADDDEFAADLGHRCCRSGQSQLGSLLARGELCRSSLLEDTVVVRVVECGSGCWGELWL